MARIKTKDLKDRYLFRVYDENESELLHRAITKFKDKFDSLNDAIKYFALVDKLADISGRQKMDFVETNAEIKTNQSLLNLITKLLHKVNQINIGNYTNDWKYSPLDGYGLEEEKQNHLQELMND